MGFKFVAESDVHRNQIFSFLKPEYRSVNDLNCSNINWTYGVYDEENDIFLTLVFYVPEGISHCGIEYRDYIIIYKKTNIFIVSYNYNFDKGEREFSIPPKFKELSENIKRGIKIYSDYKLRKQFSDSLKKDKTIEELSAESEKMQELTKDNSVICSEKDARKLFEKHCCNGYTVRNLCSKKTVAEYEKYSSKEKEIQWRTENCKIKLNEIRNGCSKDTVNKNYNDLRMMIFYFHLGTEDSVMECFNETYNYIIDNISNSFISSAVDYIDEIERFSPQKIKKAMPLVDYLKNYIEENFSGKEKYWRRKVAVLKKAEDIIKSEIAN